MAEFDSSSFLGGVDIDVFKFDLRVLLVTLRRRIIFLVIIPVITASLAFGYVAFFKAKYWQAKCILWRHTNMEKLEGDLPNIYKPLNTNVVIEMIRTKHNMREVINDLKLNCSVNSLYGKTEVDQPEENENMINIFAIDQNPEDAKKIANALAEVFLKNYIKAQNASVQKMYDKNEMERQLTQKKLKELELQQREYLKKYKVISLSTELEGKFKQLNELELKLIEAKMLAASLKIKIANIDENMKGMKSEVRLSYEVSSIDKSELEQMEKQLYKLRQKYTDENPVVKKLLGEIAYLRKKMEQQMSMQEQKVPAKVTYGGNQVKTTLEQDRFKAEAEMQAAQKGIAQYETAIKTLKEELSNLAQLENNFYDIKRQLQQNRDILEETDKILNKLRSALKSSVSDITIMEPAETPNTPTVKRRKFIIIAGGALGFVLALVGILLSELADFTVKSKFDLDNVLKLEPLGTLPRHNQVALPAFYSAVQAIYKQIAELVEPGGGVPMIAFGDIEGATGKTFFIKKCLDIFKPQNKKILYISTINDSSGGLDEFLINDYIYNDRELPDQWAERNNNRLYFVLDDNTFITPVDKTMVERFLTRLSTLEEYDYIFWELFNFNKNEQLFATICQASSLTVIMTRFRRSSKFKVLKCIDFLKNHHCWRIGGILNCIDKKYYWN